MICGLVLFGWIKQAAQANAKYFHALEEIKLKDNLISEF